MVVRSKKQLEEKLEQGFYLVRKLGRWYVQKRLPSGKYLTEAVSRELWDYCEEIRGLKDKEKEVETTVEKAEKKIVDKAASSVVKTVTRAIDQRAKWIMEWGTWVENNLLPYAEGRTFEEKAKFVIEMLEELKRSFVEYSQVQDKLKKLEAENRALKDLLNVMMQRMSVYDALRDALKTAVANGSDPEIINLILSRLIELGGVKSWSESMQS